MLTQMHVMNANLFLRNSQMPTPVLVNLQLKINLVWGIANHLF